MKYPIITTPYLPNLYKQNKKVLALHILYQDEGFLGNDPLKKDWLTHILEQFYEIVESNFTTCTASRVFTPHGTLVIFKDNLSKQLLTEFVENLLAEISSYCEHAVKLQYQLTTAVLMQEGVPAKMTMANKLGEELLDSPAGCAHMTTLSKERKARGKYFRSYEEYLHTQQKAQAKKAAQPMASHSQTIDKEKEKTAQDSHENPLEILQALVSQLNVAGQEKVITYIQDLHERYYK